MTYHCMHWYTINSSVYFAIRTSVKVLLQQCYSQSKNYGPKCLLKIVLIEEVFMGCRRWSQNQCKIFKVGRHFVPLLSFSPLNVFNPAKLYSLSGNILGKWFASELILNSDQHLNAYLQRQSTLSFVLCSLTWRLSVDPVPTDRVVDMTSVSINPDVSVPYHAVRVSHYELLKHVVNVLICDDRQRWIPSLTKLSRIIPTQHCTASVETIVFTVHLVALRHLVCLCEAGTYATYIMW